MAIEVRRNGVWVDNTQEKKRVNGAWVSNSPYKVMKPTISGVPPFTFKSDGENLRDWSITGQTVQTSTPSPSSPVDVNGVGERTGNLFDKSTNIVAYYLAQTTGIYTATTSTSRSVLIPCEPSKTYTVHVPTNATLRMVEFDHYPQAGDAGSNYTSQETGTYINKDVTVTTTATAKYLCIFCYNSAHEATKYTESAYFAQVMIVEGSTAQPYEPYGWCVPVTCGGQTTNIYLGSATSTRRIKKLVLTGEETDWTLYQSSSIGQYGVYQFYINKNIISGVINSSCRCNIMPYGITAQNRGNYLYGAYPVNSGRSIALQMKGSEADFPTVDSFKTFLQQQYANGTPVTVWYVLATPETAATNEPLMKIGSYADEISKTGTGVDIPTVNGSNTLSVGTTVQPSEMSIESISQWV